MKKRILVMRHKYFIVTIRFAIMKNMKCCFNLLHYVDYNFSVNNVCLIILLNLKTVNIKSTNTQICIMFEKYIQKLAEKIPFVFVVIFFILCSKEIFLKRFSSQILTNVWLSLFFFLTVHFTIMCTKFEALGKMLKDFYS